MLRIVLAIALLALAAAIPASAQPAPEPEPDETTGIHLQGRGPDAEPPGRWSVEDIATETEVARISGRWGFAAVPPGRYVVWIEPAGQSWTRYAQVEVRAGEIIALAVESGIALAGPTPDAEPPANWYLDDAATGAEVARIQRRWGIAAVPPGHYVLSVDLPDQRRSRYAEVEVHEGEIKPVTLVTAENLDWRPLTPGVREEVFPGLVNLAAAALGTRIRSSADVYDGFDVAMLNDGMVIDEYQWLNQSRGYLSVREPERPIRLMMEFPAPGPYWLHGVAIDLTFHRGGWGGSPARTVEIVVIGAAHDNERSLGLWRLEDRLGLQPIRFDEPVEATALEIRIHDAFGAWDRIALGEIEVYAELNDAAAGLLDRIRPSIAAPQLGGAVLFATSNAGDNDGPGRAMDGDRSTSWKASSAELPQRLVLGFPGGCIASISGLAFAFSDPEAGGQPSLVLIETSVERHPLHGYQRLNVYRLPRDANVEARLPQPVQARHLRLTVLETHDGRPAEIAGIHVWEPAASVSGQSALQLAAPCPDDARLVTVDQTDAHARDAQFIQAWEQEPNDTAELANPLAFSQWMGAAHEPDSDIDYFTFDLSESEASAVTIRHRGRPDIKNTLTLARSTGEPVLRRDPTHTGDEDVLTLLLAPDRYLVRSSVEIARTALLFDASGSMRDSVELLKEAAADYVAEARDHEEVAALAFAAGTVHEFHPFSRDFEAVGAAIREKLFAQGGTPLYDALLDTIARLADHPGQRTLVLLSDGADSTSRNSAADVWRELDRSGVRLHVIGLGGDMEALSVNMGIVPSRLLTAWAEATGGIYLFARTGEDLQEAYDRISADVRADARYALHASVAEGKGLLRVVAAGDIPGDIEIPPPRFQLILDASGSMRDPRELIDGRLRIDVARDVLTQIIDELPEGSEVALRAYGHRVREYSPGDCEDSELLVPFHRLDRAWLKEVVAAVPVRGTTPLTYSLVQAAKDLVEAPGEKLIVLVTDGEEYCGADPEKVGEILSLLGIGLRVEVVGFGLADEFVKAEMERVAALTGGGFYDTQDTDSLREGLRRSLALPFHALDAVGTRVGSGVVGGDAVELPTGIYKVVVPAGGEELHMPRVRLAADELAEVDLSGSVVASSPVATHLVADEVALPEEEVWTTLDILERWVLASQVNRPGPRADPRVHRTQRILTEVGFDPGPADGRWGPRTAAALRAFQEWYPDAELPRTGQLDDITYRALIESRRHGLRMDGD